MKNFGLTDERYAQLQSIGYNDDDIQEIIEGWGEFYPCSGSSD